MLKNKTYSFLAFTFVISYALAAVYYLLGFKYTGTAVVVFGAIYMFIPAICVVILEKLIHKQTLKDNLAISFKINKWFVAGWLIGPMIMFITLAVSLFFPGVSYSPEMDGMIKRFEEMLTPEQIEEIKKSIETLPFHRLWLTLIQGLIAGATINAVAAFGEELGWRGFLLKEFKDMSFFKASFIIGFIWGIWHAPLILMGHNYPQHPVVGVLMMTLWCMVLSPLFVYITIKSRSVIAAAIFHGTLNATGGIAVMIISGGNDLTVGVTGLAGFIGVTLILIGVFVYDTLIDKERIMSQPINANTTLFRKD